jgi:uncharacterized protein
MEGELKEAGGASHPDAQFRAALADYIAREARPPDKFGHQPRLYALARLVGAGHNYDDDVVFAAAWLHDLGVFAGHRPDDPDALSRWDHVAYAIARAPEVLTRVGFPAVKIPAVLEVIAKHQPLDKPTTMEGVVLRDADILEQLGAIGVLRAVCKVGRDTRYQTFTAAVAALNRALQSLPTQLALDTARVIAEPKVRALRAFLSAVEAESQDALF